MKRNLLALLIVFVAMSLSAQPSRYRGDKAPGYRTSPRYVPQSSNRTTYSDKSPVYFGLRGGLSVSFYEGEDSYDDYYGDYYDNSTNAIAGFHVGYVVGLPIAKDLYIETGLFFGNKGYSAKGTDESSFYDDEYCRYKETMRTYNFDIPINLLYRANLSNNSFFDIKGGPYLTYAAFGTFTTKEWSESGHYDKFSLDLDEYEDERGNFNRFGVGVNFGCGFGIDNFYVGIDYQIGLTKAISGSGWGQDYRENNFKLSLGCNF